MEIDYTAVLADLEAKKTALEASIAGIRSMLGQSLESSAGTAVSTAGKPASVQNDSFFGMAVGEAAKKYLGMVRKTQNVQEIASALEAGGITHTSKTFATTVFTALKRRENGEGDIVRVKRGAWGLAEWYPGRRRPTKDDTDKKDTEPPVTNKTEVPAKPKYKRTIPPAGNTESSSQTSEENGGNTSIASQIQNLLDSDPKKDWLVSEVFSKIPGVKKNSVSSILFKLQRQGNAKKVGASLWRSAK